MKTFKPQKRVLLNHDLCKIIEENGKTVLYIKMGTGEFAVQRPYETDLRGQISALQLALDVLSGKIILGNTVQLDERDFQGKTLESIETKKLIGN